MATSASIHFSIPHALFLHRSAGAGASPSTLCTPFSLKPLPKLAISPCVTDRPYSRFIRNVAFSSDLDEDVEAGEEDSLDFSAAEEPYFSPDLKLFVGNLPFNVDSAVLAELFGKVGNVEMVEVIYDKQTGRSRGFGFVTMSTVEEVVAAAERFNGYELEGRALRVNSGPPPSKEERPSFRGGREGGSPFRGGREGGSPFRGGREGGSPFRGGRDGERTGFNDSNKLYVGNLAWSVDDLALETLFSEQGKVKEARVVYDRESGRSRGFGFVTYSSAEEVTNAIEMFDGIDLSGRSIRVSVAESRPPREY